jgi:hypothetical protein
VRSDQTIAVSIDVSAPSCSAVRLPDDPAVGPYLWFRGRVLPHGTFANAQGYEANTVLVAVLRMLARACPGVLTR